MAHLSSYEVQARRIPIIQDIMAAVAINPGFELYYLQCSYKLDCGCEPEVPKIILKNCFYPGELDFFLYKTLSATRIS